MIALLNTLEQQIGPVSSIGYDSAILVAYAAQPPQPQEAIARFTQEFAGMNSRLKMDSSQLQSALTQTVTQARIGAREFKAGQDRMRIGSVPPPVQEQPGPPLSQQAMHAAQMQYQQQQAAQAQRMRG
jgi:hypothetical protein